MIDVYYWPTPNGHKIRMFVEETGIAHRIIPVNIGKEISSSRNISRFRPTTVCPRSWITSPGVAAGQCRCSNRAQFFSTSPRKRSNLFRPRFMHVRKCCSGCSGRLPASGRWRDRTGTSMSTRRRSCLTRSLHQGDQPPVWRPQPAARGSGVHRRRIFHRGYCQPSLDRAVQGPRSEPRGLCAPQALVRSYQGAACDDSRLRGRERRVRADGSAALR